MITTPNEAYAFLIQLGATPRLISHLMLVGEAAEELIVFFNSIGLRFDANFVRLGVSIHDAGKIIHKNELVEKGNLHEPAGEKLLLKNGIDTKLARICLSHARFDEMDCSIEELIIALADKLWKGKRVDFLEKLVIEKITESVKGDKWDLYIKLDSCFESIALNGDNRLKKQFNS